MKYDLLMHAFNTVQHMPQIGDYIKLRLHFDTAVGQLAIKPQVHKLLFNLKKEF